MGTRAFGRDGNGMPMAGPVEAWDTQLRLLGISESVRDPVRIISSAQVLLRRLRRFAGNDSGCRSDAALQIMRIRAARDTLLRWSIIGPSASAAMPSVDRGSV